jgi:serine/threonine protein kinase
MTDIAGWKTEKTLAEGGQGQIFLVTRNEVQAVLKRLKNTANQERLSRFRREIEVGQRLTHPYIARVMEHDIAATKPYFIAEYCPLGSLEDISLSEWSVVRRLQLFHKLCQGVAHAHSRVLYTEI